MDKTYKLTVNGRVTPAVARRYFPGIFLLLVVLLIITCLVVIGSIYYFTD